MDAPWRAGSGGILRRANQNASLWRMPAGGGEAIQILDFVVLFSFYVSPDGVYYVGRAGSDHRAPHRFLSFPPRRASRSLPSPELLGTGGRVSPDGKKLLWGQFQSGGNVMVLNDFR